MNDKARTDEHRFLVVKHIVRPDYGTCRWTVEFVFVQNVEYYETVYGRRFTEPLARFQFKAGTEFPVFSASQMTDAYMWALRNCIERLPFKAA